MKNTSQLHAERFLQAWLDEGQTCIFSSNNKCQTMKPTLDWIVFSRKWWLSTNFRGIEVVCRFKTRSTIRTMVEDETLNSNAGRGLTLLQCKPSPEAITIERCSWVYRAWLSESQKTNTRAYINCVILSDKLILCGKSMIWGLYRKTTVEIWFYTELQLFNYQRGIKIFHEARLLFQPYSTIQPRRRCLSFSFSSVW